ncbi:extracellular tyrosine-protein kinase PKDCC-like isoform X2 [Eriocheir sinensis]|uniref:extracellular tyrosine-protein kinase PKDCC-like isoform X2 n=1 Tax=Eriocheir sinensis TaxID=95602 RepID=UPI0021C9E286|nr:extracellular tyrosine-protein kinase PKDCC-like isoform X2 [Eriocheir sinensis]
MARSSHLSLYLTVYLCLCLLANLALVVVFLGGQTKRRPQPAWTPSSGQTLGCDNLLAISNLTLIGSGWTKAVYRGWYSTSWVAVKTVHTSGHDMTECKAAEVSVCYRRCAAKLLQEARMLHKLTHPNVIKVYGECVPEVEYSPGPPRSGVVAMVVELGRPVRVVEILQMGYEARLQLAVDVGRILLLLARSPVGPVLMKDFRREQFVIVDGSLKLSDVDDVVVGDPQCTTARDCVMQDSTKETILASVPCDRGLCRGFNSLLNSIYASQHFMRILIPYGGPPALEQTSLYIVEQQAQGRLDSEHLHRAIQALAHNFSTGGYLTHAEKQQINNFVVFHDSTVEREDFPCLRMEGMSCVQSVSSPAEAASLCSQLPACVAFVLLDQWAWTGRQMAVFKTGAKTVREKERHTLYVRRGQG